MFSDGAIRTLLKSMGFDPETIKGEMQNFIAMVKGGLAYFKGRHDHVDAKLCEMEARLIRIEEAVVPVEKRLTLIEGRKENVG